MQPVDIYAEALQVKGRMADELRQLARDLTRDLGTAELRGGESSPFYKEVQQRAKRRLAAIKRRYHSYE